MTAPQYALVRLPDNVSFDQAARFGYLGTSYGAMKKANAVPGQSMLIDGISGTLGLGAALLGLAMGITRILGTGRNKAPFTFLVVSENELLGQIAIEEEVLRDRLDKAGFKLRNAKTTTDEQAGKLALTGTDYSLVSLRVDDDLLGPGEHVRARPGGELARPW